ncbi:fatty acid desaturase domain-containing protein [Trichoderma austrokoningii]
MVHIDSPIQPQKESECATQPAKAELTQFDGLVDSYGTKFSVPDYTLKQLRDAIPSYCFKRSVFRFLGYLSRDLLLISGTFYIFHHYVTPSTVISAGARFALWTLYSYLQGLFGTGLWVLAHECGHQSFSESRLLNDFTGWVLHSALFVPYFSWKISHKTHHSVTGHLQKDTSFMPKTRNEFAARESTSLQHLSELTEEAPLRTFLELVLQQLVGLPVYFLWNEAGRSEHGQRGKDLYNKPGGGVNHYSPKSPLFDPKDAWLIIISDVGILLAGTALYWVGATHGWFNMLIWYGVPYLWMNHWIVAIVYLHHTDPALPHYDEVVWTYVRGAAATMDRDLGFIGHHIFHGITSTHVLHHHFSAIPFYHADEATAAIIPVMGPHYRSIGGGMLGFMASLWHSARWCQWVEPCEGVEGLGKHVKFFRNRNQLGVRPEIVSAQD